MRVFVTGGRGQLASEIPAAFAGDEIIAGSRPSFDLVDERSVRQAIEQAQPDLIIHAAAYTDVDGCERDQATAYRTNALGTRFVALAARDAGARLVLVSTDYVFDGTKGEPYVEWDDPHPISIYGWSKLAAEREAVAHHDRCYVVRTSWVCGQQGRNFVKTILALATTKPELSVVDDEWGSPTFAPDLAAAIAQLVKQPVFGTYHLSNRGGCSRYELARRAIERAGLSAIIRPVSTLEYLSRYPLPARRPANTILANLAASSIGIELPSWEAALDKFVEPIAPGRS